MKTHPLPSVDTQVLLPAYHPLDGDVIKDLIVQTAVSLGIPAEDCKLLQTSTDKDIRFLCGNYHVLVTQTVPFDGGDHLNFALEAFTVKSAFPEARQLVGKTGAYTQISVKKGVLPHDLMPKEMLREIGSHLTAFCNSKETDVAMALAKDVTASIVRSSEAHAVFWGPSVFFMKPDNFLSLAESPNPVPLYLHPHLYGEKDPETGEQLIGILGSGAPWLIGHSLEIKPCALPPAYLAEIMYAFVTFTRKNGSLIDEGDVFGRDENEKVQMLIHRQDEEKPDGIELKVVYNPKFGIERDPVPTILKSYDDDCKLVGERISNVAEAELDPGDPVDAAILEQLAAQKTGTASQTPPPDVPQQEHSDPPASTRPQAVTAAEQASRAPTPANTRLSMEELRNFARQAQVTDADKDGNGKRKNLFGRLFGRKR